MTTANPTRMEDSELRVTTVIADDLEIKGSITFKSSLMIKGNFEGEILSEGLLIVGPTATVKAAITTNKLITYGKIIGNVSADENVVLKTKSSLTGDITTPNIIIENGSGFNGTCIMKKEYRPPPKETERPAATAQPFDYKHTFFATPEIPEFGAEPEKEARTETLPTPPPAPAVEEPKPPPRPDDKGLPPGAKKKGFWGR